MSPFERHGIKHLSASSLNLARYDLSLWTLSYLKKIKSRASMPMYMGSAVEEAVEHGLFNPLDPIEKCIEIAVDSFRRKTVLGGFDQEQREAKIEDIKGREAEGRKKAFAGCVVNAMEALKPYGVPTRPEGGRQHRIETWLEGIPVPIIGFKDFSFDNHGLDVDLKVTSRLPSEMSDDHLLQGSIYWKASGNRAQRFCYVSKAGSKVLEITPDAAHEHIKTATSIAHILMRFLSLSGDSDELANLTIPNYSGYRWDALTIGAAREIWGF